MAKYTNTGLVNHAKAALKMNTKYMWGGIFRTITDAYVNQLAKMYPSQYSSSRQQVLKALPDNYFGIDCVGLIKSYYWSGNDNGGPGSKYYKAASDVNAHGMYQKAKIKGPIKTIPEIPGIIVYCKSRPHVGIYIGNGKVIESTLSSKGDGVIQTNLKDWIWEYWMECPFIIYEKAVLQKATLAFYAKARKRANATAPVVANLAPGATVDVYEGTETTCKGTDGKTYVYVKIKCSAGDAWIVKSAIK